jgi:hypothetical protein
MSLHPQHPSPALRQKFMCLPHSKCRESGGLQLESQCLPFRNLVIIHLTLILLLIFRFSSLYTFNKPQDMKKVREKEGTNSHLAKRGEGGRPFSP